MRNPYLAGELHGGRNARAEQRPAAEPAERLDVLS
jgi:hypothetical protein